LHNEPVEPCSLNYFCPEVEPLLLVTAYPKVQTDPQKFRPTRRHHTIRALRFPGHPTRRRACDIGSRSQRTPRTPPRLSTHSAGALPLAPSPRCAAHLPPPKTRAAGSQVETHTLEPASAAGNGNTKTRAARGPRGSSSSRVSSLLQEYDAPLSGRRSISSPCERKSHECARI
jgi:hypothetical protein